MFTDSVGFEIFPFVTAVSFILLTACVEGSARSLVGFQGAEGEAR